MIKGVISDKRNDEGVYGSVVRTNLNIGYADTYHTMRLIFCFTYFIRYHQIENLAQRITYRARKLVAGSPDRFRLLDFRNLVMRSPLPAYAPARQSRRHGKKGWQGSTTLSTKSEDDLQKAYFTLDTKEPQECRPFKYEGSSYQTIYRQYLKRLHTLMITYRPNKNGRSYRLS